MKIAGIALFWIGVVALLKNMGEIQVIDWSIILPVFIIIVGSSMRHFKHGMMCGFGGVCAPCGSGSGHKCEGENCSTCKVK